MQTQEQDYDSAYEVGQEQLDAVDRMLDELDLEESFDRGKSLALKCEVARILHEQSEETKSSSTSQLSLTYKHPHDLDAH